MKEHNRDILEVRKPAPDSQYRLKNRCCGGSNIVYLRCKDIFGHLSWRVKCLDCNEETISGYPIQHDAQIAWNTGANVFKP